MQGENQFGDDAADATVAQFHQHHECHSGGSVAGWEIQCGTDLSAGQQHEGLEAIAAQLHRQFRAFHHLLDRILFLESGNG